MRSTAVPPIQKNLSNWQVSNCPHYLCERDIHHNNLVLSNKLSISWMEEGISHIFCKVSQNVEIFLLEMQDGGVWVSVEHQLPYFQN